MDLNFFNVVFNGCNFFNFIVILDVINFVMGKIWMDCNLGVFRVVIFVIDVEVYGYYY